MDAIRPSTALPSPRQNELLAALPRWDYERLLPKLEPVALPRGCCVYGAGDREKYLYFVTAGVVSRFYVTESGESAEFALTGSEGVIGIASFLGGERMPSQALVLRSGFAYRLRVDSLETEVERHGALLRLLLRYTEALIGQTGQIALCNRRHSVEQQVCRWVLSMLDRSDEDELSVTQALIAEMLGVRREGVTEALGNLQKEGLMHCSRGRIAVLDRRGLKARACECYGVIKRAYGTMIPRYDEAAAC